MAMVRLYAGRDAMETHHVRGYIEGHGVRAVVLGDQLGMARGELPLTAETLPAVYVNQEDAQKALDLVRAYQAQRAGASQDAGPPWTCPDCGEKIEPQFDTCWHCGHEREDESV